MEKLFWISALAISLVALALIWSKTLRRFSYTVYMLVPGFGPYRAMAAFSILFPPRVLRVSHRAASRFTLPLARQAMHKSCQTARRGAFA